MEKISTDYIGDRIEITCLSCEAVDKYKVIETYPTDSPFFFRAECECGEKFVL